MSEIAVSQGERASNPPCPKCGHPLIAAYEDEDSFWECDGCGTDVEDRDLRSTSPTKEADMAVHYIDDRNWSGLCPSKTGPGTTSTTDVTCRECLALLDAPEVTRD